MGAFLLFYALLSGNPEAKITGLREDASTVIKQMSSKDAPLQIMDDNQINISKTGRLKNITYDELKSLLKIESDFCIYFEDENGYTIIINNSYRGIGSSNINISNIPCSQKS